MPNVDRMFQVIVLGGIALATVQVAACGGSVDSPTDAGSDAFPQEGPAPLTDSGTDAFPQEGPIVLVDSGSIDAGSDAFPQEGPAPLDSGSSLDGGFPQETAAP